MASVAFLTLWSSLVRKSPNYGVMNNTAKGCGGVLEENVFNRLRFMR